MSRGHVHKVVSREFTSTRFEIYQSFDLRWLSAKCYECDNWVASMEVVGEALRAVGCTCPDRDISLEETISASGLTIPRLPEVRSRTPYLLTEGGCLIRTEGHTDGGINIHVYQWIAFWAGINVLSITIEPNGEEAVA